MTPGDGLAREAERQQALLAVLWRDRPDPALAPWLAGAEARRARGLGVYRANAQALAARALAAAYPTVAALVGEPSFAALACALWQHQPPTAGDIADWGAGLADFVADDPQLAEVPYLADVARLDWCVHRAERAADGAPADASALVPALVGCDPEWQTLRLAPGTAVVASRWPIVTLHAAHRAAGTEPDGFAAAAAALADGRGETALVVRVGWQARVQALAPAAGRFTSAVLAGRPLAAALDAAGADFEFEPWLRQALQQGWWQGVADADEETRR